MLKKIILIISGIIVTLLLIALFVNKTYSVQKEIIISKSKLEVFNYIKFLKNQDYYSKWSTMDPNMKKSYQGMDGTVGFISHWDSKVDDVGVGEQEIKKITEGERLDFELRFMEPFEATEHAFMSTFALDGTHTKVTWGFDGHMDYPMNLMLLFMDFEKMIGDDLQTGLNNLKTVLEK